jgi:hypothetical protein
MAVEELADLVAVDAKLKKIKAELRAAVLARGSSLMDITGVGPAGAARILADVGDIARFADRNRFASWTGTAPLDASSGEQDRHRHIDTSDQPLPGPAPTTLPAATAPANPRPGSAPQQPRRRAGAVKVQRPTGRTTLTATSAGAHSKEPNPAP